MCVSINWRTILVSYDVSQGVILDSFDMQFETDELSVAGLGLRGIRASAAYLSVAKLEDGKDGKPKP